MPEWNRTTRNQFLVFTVGLVLFVLLLLKCERGFVPILDSANLVFHEAGHPIFGLLGDTMNLYGGTLGQLAIPLIVIGAFWQQANPVAVAVGGVWFFENFFNIARYVADAREQILPLVGGGEHDWFNILTSWVLWNTTPGLPGSSSSQGGLESPSSGFGLGCGVTRIPPAKSNRRHTPCLINVRAGN